MALPNANFKQLKTHFIDAFPIQTFLKLGEREEDRGGTFPAAIKRGTISRSATTAHSGRKGTDTNNELIRKLNSKG